MHIGTRHQCPHCDTETIPLDADVPCPKCGLVEAERHDFIAEAVESALFNLERVGFYGALARLEMTFGNKVLSRVLHMLHADHDSGGSPPYEAQVDMWLGNDADRGEHACLRPYMRLVAMRVCAEFGA